MNDDFSNRLRAALEALEPGLDKAGEAPVGPTETKAKGYLSFADQMELRQQLRKLDKSSLQGVLSHQMRKQGQGIPLDVWMSSSGGRAIEHLLDSQPQIAKAIDTAAAGPLIRQDLEPVLYELFIRDFPAWDRFAKEPSNGLVHAFNRATGYGDAEFMPELGTVTDSQAEYERATTPITILATRRGVTIKAQAAVPAGGMSWDPAALELQAGLRAIAHKMQKTIFQGNATVSSGTDANEDGEFDANAFDGLRQILDGSGGNDPEDVDPTASPTPENIRQAFNDAMISTTQAAGQPSVIYIDPEAMGQFDKQQDDLVRYIERQNLTVGTTVRAVATTMGDLPLFVVPGDSIGEYTHSAQTVSDAYMIDERAVSVPYLGSDGPTVLDIPVGVSGQLTRLFIIFGMWGFAVKAIPFHNKVRIRRA